MQMDWIMGLLGGLLIGTGGAVYLLINGRVMGASGILGGLIDGSGRATAAERIAFVIGIFAIPTLIVALTGTVETPCPDVQPFAIRVPMPTNNPAAIKTKILLVAWVSTVPVKATIKVGIAKTPMTKAILSAAVARPEPSIRPPKIPPAPMTRPLINR